jgi:hypothetical protein
MGGYMGNEDGRAADEAVRAPGPLMASDGSDHHPASVRAADRAADRPDTIHHERRTSGWCLTEQTMERVWTQH